jgi:hypothetical protein
MVKGGSARRSACYDDSGFFKHASMVEPRFNLFDSLALERLHLWFDIIIDRWRQTRLPHHLLFRIQFPAAFPQDSRSVTRNYPCTHTASQSQHFRKTWSKTIRAETPLDALCLLCVPTTLGKCECFLIHSPP